MKKVILQINTEVGRSSVGKISEDIGGLAIDSGLESRIAYGRGKPDSRSRLIRIGNDWDLRMHALQTRLFDNHGLASKSATWRFIDDVKKIRPDLIHLHNIHGYYLNYPILFRFLKEYGAPIVWTLHDCWPFTGHCAHYDIAQCCGWQTECHDCPQKEAYPASRLADRSRLNHRQKKESFSGCPGLTFVLVSDWLQQEFSQSFLSSYPSTVIHNGIDLSVFRPSEAETRRNHGKVVLGVANVWNLWKGLDEFIRLREGLPKDYVIVLVGLNRNQIAKLPKGINGIPRIENAARLAELYSGADVFVNPTFGDSFPTTNIESLACGTPVITYRTGGAPETIDDKTGVVVGCGNIGALITEVRRVCETRPFSSSDCRRRAETLFDKNNVLRQYIGLYDSLLQHR